MVCETQVTSSRLLEWKKGKLSDSKTIYSIIRQVIHTAKLSSPSTSPIKDPEYRKVVLKTFGCMEQTKNFDFFLNNLVVRDAESDDEIVELGNLLT
jgi:hypothetical protein